MARKTHKEKKASPRYVYTGHEEFPKINIKLTYQELEILFKQPPELMKLYMFLNLYRDFNTNITGEAVHIDDASFKLWLGYPSKTGRKGWKPSTTHVVRWLEQLEVLGLIQRRGNNVFYLPLAYKKTHESEISHQGVTNLSPNIDEGVTKTCLQENDVLPSKNRDETLAHVNEVSPNNQTGVTEVGSRLYTIPGNTLHNITLPGAHDFFQLLAKQGYYVNQLQDNKSTRAMVHQWVGAKVSLEEAQIGINHANAQKPPKPDTPSYYLKPVLQVRKDFEHAQQQASEVSSNERQPAPQSTKTVQSRYPKSATRQFWERQEAIMQGLNEDDN